MNTKVTCRDIIRKDERCDEFNLYRYELTVRFGTGTADYRLPLYSIRITMTDSRGNTSEECVTDAFSDTEKALRFYEKIVSGKVTPIDLPYVLEDERAIG